MPRSNTTTRKPKVFWTPDELKLMHDHISVHSLNGESELTRINRAQKAVLTPKRRRVLSIAKADQIVDKMTDMFVAGTHVQHKLPLELIRQAQLSAVGEPVDTPEAWDVEMSSAELHKFAHLLRAGLLIKVV